jgi:amino acid adenylation domain-containing protein
MKSLPSISTRNPTLYIQTLFENLIDRLQDSEAVSMEHAFFKEAQYWETKLQAPISILDLPKDFKRRQTLTDIGQKHVFHLNQIESSEVHALSKKLGVSLIDILLTAYKITLFRYTNQEDIIVGVPTENNVLAIRTVIDQNKTFSEVLKLVELNCREAHENQQILFHQVLKNINYIVDEAHMPVFQTLFGPHRLDTDLNGRVFTDLDWWVDCENVNHQNIQISINYRQDLFKAITIQRMSETFKHVLKNINENLNISLSNLKAIPASIEEMICNVWNDPIQAIKDPRPVHKIFEVNVKSTPNGVAVETSKEKLNYLELDHLSNCVANALIKSGIIPGDLVAISLNRSANLIATLLGVLKAGAGYVPIDPAFPQERIEYMLSDSKPKLLITEELLPKLLKHSDVSRPELPVDLNNTVYVIYTSGSTGQPKGVQVSHGSLTNLALVMNEKFNLSNIDKLLAVTSWSFDVAASEIFAPLVAGATIYLADEKEVKDGLLLKNILQAKNITMMQATPSTWRMLLASGWVGNKNLRVNCGGEAFPLDLAQTLIPTCREVWNMYGPTETTVLSSCKKLTLDMEFVTIGKSMKNTFYYILDEKLSMKPVGSIGELYIGGLGVAKGYIGKRELTDKKFLNDPFHPGGKMYATGDLARFTFDGEVIWCGRNDGQVKVRGHRIELGEIELKISHYPESGNVFVKVVEIEGEANIVAYFTGTSEISKLRSYLRLELPHYMVPNFFVKLDSLPLSPSGKVDSKNLPLPRMERPELEVSYIPATTPTQLMIEKCWKKFIKIDKVGLDDNFFDLGGTSLVSIKILVEINEHSKKKLTVANLFQFTTVREISNFIDGEVDLGLHVKLKTINQEAHDIAVIGMTGRFPGAKNVDEFWDNLLNLKNSITKFDKAELNPSVSEELAIDENYVYAEGEYPGQASFDYKFFGMTALESELMDPQQRKFLELTHEGLELAGYNPENYKGSIGVFAGMGPSKYSRLVDLHPEKAKLLGDFNVTLGLEKDYLATRVAYKLNLRGPAININTACSTSLVAVIEAVKNLRANTCDMALAGGISISGTPKYGHLYTEGGITSKNGECRSFDSEASGTVFTDGGGVVVLKRLSDAQLDGDNILAVIKGVGLNNDGFNKMSFSAPSVKGQAEAIMMAHADAGVSADAIGFVEAHGTATPVGDPIEVEALTKAFEQTTTNKNFCYLGAVKSNIGHTNTAAGIASFIKAVKVVHTGTIPGTVHFTKKNPLINFDQSPFVVNHLNSKFPENSEYNKLRKAGVSSFGVGGTNAHVIIEEYRAEETTHKTDLTPALFKLSAKTAKQLELMQKDLKYILEKNDPSEWKKISYTLETGREEYKFRSYSVGKNKKDIYTSPVQELKTSPSVIFMFPGQGSHYPEMGIELYKNNTIFKTFFDQCCNLLDSIVPYEMKDILFSENAKSVLDNTYYSQPAIFIIEYSLAMTLKFLGVTTDNCIGHSIGEFVAATLNGVFTLEDGLRAIAKRAELMRALPEGKMLSVPLNVDKLKELIKNTSLDIAAINGHSSCVVSGTAAEITTFKKHLENLHLASIELKTSHAFHSRMMEPAYKPFLEFLTTLKLSAPKNPMVSTVTANFEQNLFATPQYWADQMISPVMFVNSISTVMGQSNIMLLEVGTKNTLTNLAKKEMSRLGLELKAVSLLADKPHLETVNFMKALGELWLSGIKPENPEVLYQKEDMFRVIASVYAFEENHLWLESIPQKNKKLIVSNKDVVMNNKLTSLQNTLKGLFEKASGNENGTYDGDTSFLEMGMDSLFLSQFSMVLKKELKVNVTFRQLMEDLGTINLLASYLENKVEIKIPAQALKSIPKKEMKSEVVTSQIPVSEKVITLPAVNGSVEALINRQLEIMSQQILLLKGEISAQPATESYSSTPVIVPEVGQPVISKKDKISVSNAKTAFGAQARITTEKTPLTNYQAEQVKMFIDKYTEKTKSSKKFAQDNRKNHADPRAVTGFKPESKEIIYPVVIKKSKMQTLWDVDDNMYIDMINGFGSNFFGNGNPIIKKHVMNQIEEGIEIGPQHPLVSEVSMMINELTGNERTAFCSTGSEAVLGAMRVARTVTGREKIIVFSGSYHGIHDEVIIRGSKSGASYPAAPGINNEAVSNMIVLDYGTEESLQIIREMAGEVAAVLVEPVQSRRCDFHPVEFLKEVRKITLESKTCLIFDEIITGFRVHLAGAQGYFEIRADLCTYGKIIGGGMPIGIVSGKAEYMDALDGGYWQYGDDSTPTVGVTYFAGTFVRHPLALASAKGALEVLKSTGAEGLDRLNKRAQRFVDDMNLFLMTESVPMEINNFGSLIKPKWKADIASGDLMFAILRYNGVHVYDGFPWFVNLAHTEDELAVVLNAFKNAVKTMQKMGLFPTNKNSIKDDVYLDPNIFDQKGAPMPEAKIGRDEKGNPAWFVEDPENAGEYYLLQ